MTVSEELSSCFPEPPKVCTGGKNLKCTLCKSDITTSSKDSNLEQNHPCNHGNAMLVVCKNYTYLQNKRMRRCGVAPPHQ